MEKVKLELNFSQMLQFMNSSLYTDYLVYQLYISNSFFLVNVLAILSNVTCRFDNWF